MGSLCYTAVGQDKVHAVSGKYEGVSKRFQTESITKYTLNLRITS